MIVMLVTCCRDKGRGVRRAREEDSGKGRLGRGEGEKDVC